MDIQPKDHAEQVALFRSEIIGALTRRELDHGELQAELEALSKRRFRPPGGEATRTYSIPTLERWYYRLSVTSITPTDTVDYIAFRLAAIGCNREIFTTDAISMLHEAALGSLRDVDRVATAALREAARKKRKLVERDIVSKVVGTTEN